MKNTIGSPVTLSTQTVVKLTSLLSSYLSPEYSALFAGWKKLTEKTYGPLDSSIPLVAIDIKAS